MKIRIRAHLAAATAGLLLIGACADRGQPVETAAIDSPDSFQMNVELACRADVVEGVVSCAPPSEDAGERSLIVGGQGRYVQLTSSNLAFDGSVFSFDVTVQNLIKQAMGTQDGVTPHANGVRVFFEVLPTTTSGTGNVTVTNPDGTDTFTRANQPYYQYDGILEPNEVTPARQWQLTLDPGVETFAFTVFVSTEVQYQGQWVDLQDGATSMMEGQNFSLTAQVRDRVGNAMPASIDWGTSNAAVALVDGTGEVTAMGPGTAMITASSGVATPAQVQVTVCPDLAVGEVYTASMPAASELCFAGGSGATAEYTYIPLNRSTASSISLTTTASGIVGSVAGPPSPALLPVYSLAGTGTATETSIDPRHLEALDARSMDLAPAISRTIGLRSSTSAPTGPNFTIVPGVPTVGDLMDLNVARECSGAVDMRTGQVRAVSTHLVVLADTANPAGGFTTAQYDSIALEFDSIAYPVITDNFGAPTDLDGNDRVVAFFTRAVNEQDPPASSVVTSGYFESRDLFSAGSCARSNEGEVIYMLVPDPTGAVNSNVRTVSSTRGSTIRTLGHELQHLVNASRRTHVLGTGLEETWLDEGLSRIAEELMFYRTSFGLAPGQNINLSNLTSGSYASRRVAAFNTYANGNYGRLRPWLQRPDTTGALRATSGTSLGAQGAAWAFLRYAADRVGGDQSVFWSGLISSETGLSNLESAIGADPTEWVADFTAAMYADDAVAGAGAEYTNPSWNYRSVFGGLGGFPLGVRVLSNGVGLTLSYQSGAAASYLRFGVADGNYATVSTLSGGSPPAGTVAVRVIRTK